MQKMLGWLVLCLFVSTLQVFATSASRTINYQGRLTDSTNAPVADNTYVMTFRLYEESSGPLANAKWSEPQSVATKNGYFNVVLGGTNSFNASQLDFSKQYWLGIQVSGDTEMSPRQSLSGVPMTLNYDMPIGTITAWHKNMSTYNNVNLPPISSQWVECNGQTLNDPESVFHQQVIPNLNGASGTVSSPGNTYTAQMFLRGGTTSGVGQVDELKSHNHNYMGIGAYHLFNDGANYNIPAVVTTLTTTAIGGSETRPVNMSVVWIMKIK